MIFASPLARAAGMAAWWIPAEFVFSYGGAYIMAFLHNSRAPWFEALAFALLALALSLPPYVIIMAGADREYWRNRPTYTPAPKPADVEPGMIRLTSVMDNSIMVYHLPCNTKQIAALYQGLAVDRSLSGRRWYQGKGSPFSQTQFKRLVDEMLRRGLANRVGNSTYLTEIGAQAFERGACSPALSVE